MNDFSGDQSVYQRKKSNVKLHPVQLTRKPSEMKRHPRFLEDGLVCKGNNDLVFHKNLP